MGNEDNIEEGIADKCQPISPEWPAECCHRFIAQCRHSLLWLGDCWQHSGQDLGQDLGHNSGLFLAKSVATCYTFAFLLFGRKFIAGRCWEILKNFIKYIKNFSKIFKKFWELDRKIFSPVQVPSVVWLGWAWKTRVKRLLQFFSHLHNYETFRHIYTCQSSDQFDFFELAWVLHGKPFVGFVGQPDNLTT